MAENTILSPIWSQTPGDILCIIIKHTEDLQTLCNWCIASYRTRLYPIAFAHQFRIIEIDQVNLAKLSSRHSNVQQPQADEGSESSVLSSSDLKKQLLQREQRMGLLPARFVKHLKLNRGPIEWPWVIRYQPTWSAEAVEDRLKQLLQAATKLEHIDIWWEMTEGLAKIIFDNIRFTCRILSIGDEVGTAWAQLANLYNLECLSVALNEQDDYDSLATALSRLKTLKALSIDTWSPIAQPFLDCIFHPYEDQNADKCKLPESLESFTFLTGSEYQKLSTPKPPQTEVLPNLRYVCTNLSDMASSVNLFSWLSGPSLEDIAVSSVFLDDDHRYFIDFDAAIGLASPNTRRIQLCFDVCVRTNAVLSPGPGFYVLSVVTAGRTSAIWDESKGYTRVYPQIFDKEIAAWTVIRSIPGIRHLRLEQVDLGLIEPQHFNLDSFTHLRILMLYPWTYTSTPLEAYGRLPESGIIEGRVLQSILPVAPPYLRVLCIGSYQIWLSRQGLGDFDGSPRPMPLAEAKANDEEMEIMRRDLTNDDWQFIKSSPSRPMRDLSLSARNEPGLDSVGTKERGRMPPSQRSHVVLIRTPGHEETGMS